MLAEEYEGALMWYSRFYDCFPEYYSAFGEDSKSMLPPLLSIHSPSPMLIWAEIESAGILSQVLLKRGISYFNYGEYTLAAGDFNTVVELEMSQAAVALNWLGKIAASNFF
jgi:hypothetical protein